MRTLPIGNQTIRIIDGLLPDGRVREVHDFVRTLPFQHIRYGYRDAPERELQFGTQWVHGITPEERTKLPIEEIEGKVKTLLPEQLLEPGRAHISCIQPNDIRYPHIDDSTGRIVTALYFVNSEWRAEWAGELIFYAEGEPLYAVQPRSGRVIVFDGTIVHRGGVPSGTCPEVRYAIAFKLMRGK